MTVAILTISDSCAAGTREDLSGPGLAHRCEQLAWTTVARSVVPDDVDTIAQQLANWADAKTASLILTTGGTGVSARDVTPEATRRVLQRELPGVSEWMRSKGLEQTPLSILSRGLAGVRGNSMIVNLPGSPKGALFSLGAIEHLVPHVVDLLEGKTQH